MVRRYSKRQSRRRTSKRKRSKRRKRVQSAGNLDKVIKSAFRSIDRHKVTRKVKIRP